jgi:hypothetical protein
VKFTGDPKGLGHYEVGGIARFFRDRTYPGLPFSTTAATAGTASTGVNDTVVGGGFFASAKVPVKTYADVALKITQGDGTARYTSSNLGDVTVKPDGSLEPLRSSTGLFEIDGHIGKKLDIIGIAGGEYLQRTFYSATIAATATAPAKTVQVGYAPISGENDSACFTEIAPTANSGYAPGAGTCTGHTRAIFEGTGGFVYRFYNSPAKGRLQFSMLYSYLTKEAWTGLDTHTPSGVAHPEATNNMVFTSFRYYLP